MSCRVFAISNVIGKKWTLPIVEEIALRRFYGFNRFLARAESITPRILSKQMKELEKGGLVEKRIHRRDNCNVTEYVLTRKGAEFHRLIIEIKKWNVKWNKVPDFCLRTTCTECPNYRDVQ
jgi:DNA-binding HxlR family transcriptional regulator